MITAVSHLSNATFQLSNELYEKDTEIVSLCQKVSKAPDSIVSSRSYPQDKLYTRDNENP